MIAKKEHSLNNVFTGGRDLCERMLRFMPGQGHAPAPYGFCRSSRVGAGY